MAFKLAQEFSFENADYNYDRNGDVLYVSFGPPAPAIALQIEDWLALRVGLKPPFLGGMTVVGFRKIFEKINRYIERELPARIEKLNRVLMTVSYDDETDTMIMRMRERRAGWSQFFGLFEPRSGPVTIFEPVVPNVYVEKSLPTKDIVGLKIVDFTKSGQAAIEAVMGALIDTIFEPHEQHDENSHLIADAIVRQLRRLTLVVAPS